MNFSLIWLHQSSTLLQYTHHLILCFACNNWMPAMLRISGGKKKRKEKVDTLGLQIGMPSLWLLTSWDEWPMLYLLLLFAWWLLEFPVFKKCHIYFNMLFISHVYRSYLFYVVRHNYYTKMTYIYVYIYWWNFLGVIFFQWNFLLF